ncbi:MAG: hypothetical protein AAB069_00350, partial [Planctomycetota bacterium]
YTDDFIPTSHASPIRAEALSYNDRFDGCGAWHVSRRHKKAATLPFKANSLYAQGYHTTVLGRRRNMVKAEIMESRSTAK